MNYFIVFDTETTGVGQFDKPCQIAACLVNSHTLTVVQHAQSLINPEREINPAAQAVHGIDNSMVKNTPTLPQFFESDLVDMFAQVDMVCGHNVAFDLRMCQSVLHLYQFKILDTLTLARNHYPNLPNHKLQTLVSELKLPARLAHDAMGDVQSCLDFMRLVSNGRSAHQMWQDQHKHMADLKKKVHSMGVGHA